FGIASSVLLIIVCTVVTNRVVEPRFGKYQGAVPSEGGPELSADESRGLTYAFLAGAATFLVICLLTLPSGAPLRSPTTGEIIGDSPFMASLVFFIMAVFGLTGIAYGIGARTIKTTDEGIDAITKTLADLGGLLFLFFVISQFVAYFNFSNMGTV